jgi:hypothetical protein
LNGADGYRGLEDRAAFLQLVENVEAILAEEQQIYWRDRAAQSGGGKIIATIPKKDDP